MALLGRFPGAKLNQAKPSQAKKQVQTKQLLSGEAGALSC